MGWVDAVGWLRAHRLPGVLVTVSSVRGHAPRAAGAKMVVSADRTWASIGGGNVESVAIERARTLLRDGATAPVSFTSELTDKARYEHGVQCCGGRVEVLLEPLGVAPAVAIFGLGHVGSELARILARHDLDLHLTDSRAEFAGATVLDGLADAEAIVHLHHVPVLPELTLAELPPGTHVLVMTHDHAEDYALLDAVLRTPALVDGAGLIGLIGSAAKWSRFRTRLAAAGHDESLLARVTTPIGIPGLTGKEPPVIAVAVAADLLLRFATDPTARAGARPEITEARA